MRLGPPIAAAMPVYAKGKDKTVLQYSQESGAFRIVRVQGRTQRTQTFELSAAELQGIIGHWPEWRDWLLNAGVDSVAPQIPITPPPTDPSPSSPTLL